MTNPQCHCGLIMALKWEDDSINDVIFKRFICARGHQTTKTYRLSDTPPFKWYEDETQSRMDSRAKDLPDYEARGWVKR